VAALLLTACTADTAATSSPEPTATPDSQTDAGAESTEELDPLVAAATAMAAEYIAETAPTSTPEATGEAETAEEPEATEEEPDQTAEPEPTPEATLYPEPWMNMPAVPEVTDTAREIYAEGMRIGRNPHSFSIVGDCQSVMPNFLAFFDRDYLYRLGPYSYLQEMIDNFAGSFYRPRYAVGQGCNVAAVLDKSGLMADPEVCKVGEMPLECEVRMHNPSIAIISMETNYRSFDDETYKAYLSEIVEFFIKAKIVPIIGTKADNLEGGFQRNALVAEVALEYDIPMWNFWAAVQPLPNGGITWDYGDDFHLSWSHPYFDDPVTLTKGWGMRNLTALQTIDSIWRGVNDMPPGEPQEPAEPEAGEGDVSGQ